MNAEALHVVDQGPRNAPAVVLIHSIATHSAMWSFQIPIWSRSYRVLAVDLPGHGQSPPEPCPQSRDTYVEILGGMLERFGLQRPSIVGLSLGGMIAQRFALRHPERVHSLVVANSSAGLPAGMSERWEARKLQALDQGMESQVVSTLERWFTPEFLSRSPMTAKWIADMIRMTHPEGYRAAIAAIQAANTFDELPSIRCPLLAVAGRHDMATPVEALKTLVSRVPGAQLEILEGASHLSNIAEPVEFAERVRAFLARAHDGDNRAA